jgi:Putative serine esterase (DUF676)
MEMLKIINESPSSENLVIFIHGFNGTDDTWQMPDNSLPFIEALLHNERIKGFYNFALFKYASKIRSNNKPINIFNQFYQEAKRKITGNQKNYNLAIPEIINVLESNIQLYCSGKGISKINCYLIAHSMGGLVAKAFICKNIDNTLYQFRQYHSINAPHGGSNIASISNTFAKSNKQIQDLMPDSKLIMELTKNWISVDDFKLPKTIYYAGYSDNTVSYNLAIGHEKRTNNHETISHNGGHSEFLISESPTLILKNIESELSKGIEELLIEKKKQAALIEQDIKEKFSQLDKLVNNCENENCFYFKDAVVQDIVNHVCKFNYEIDELEKRKMIVEINYILKSLKMFFIDSETERFRDLNQFSYQTVYRHIFDYIEINLIGKCICSEKDKFNKLREILLVKVK